MSFHVTFCPKILFFWEQVKKIWCWDKIISLVSSAKQLVSYISLNYWVSFVILLGWSPLFCLPAKLLKRVELDWCYHVPLAEFFTCLEKDKIFTLNNLLKWRYLYRYRERYIDIDIDLFYFFSVWDSVEYSDIQSLCSTLSAISIWLTGLLWDFTFFFFTFLSFTYPSVRPVIYTS